MKRSFLTLIALVLISSVLSGCGALSAGNNVSSAEKQIDYYQLA